MPDLTDASSLAARDSRLNGGLAEGMPESDPSTVLKQSGSRKSRETISQKKLLSVKNLLHRKDSKRVPERIPESEQAEETVEAVKQSQTFETGGTGGKQSKFYSLKDSPKEKGSNGSKGSKASKGSNNTSSSKRKRMEELKKRFATQKASQKASEHIHPTPTSPEKPNSAPLPALQTPEAPERLSETAVQQRLDHRRLKKELKRRKQCYARATLAIAIVAIVLSSLMLAFLAFCAYQIPKVHSEIAQATALSTIAASMKDKNANWSRLRELSLGANLTIVTECQMGFIVHEYVLNSTMPVYEERYVARNA
ncbi:hypothetical protein AAVH_05681 [Aphelenchoides avenae]|nr:hypothetical protein AAVH_05681 [Aphelenchus avenae]